MLSKLCLIGTIIIFFSVNGFCQNYQPLPIENVIWQEYEYNTFQPCVVETWLIYYTYGDTFISASEYSKMYYESNRVTGCGYHAPPSEEVTVKTYVGSIRQDTAEE